MLAGDVGERFASGDVGVDLCFGFGGRDGDDAEAVAFGEGEVFDLVLVVAVDLGVGDIDAHGGEVEFGELHAEVVADVGVGEAEHIEGSDEVGVVGEPCSEFGVDLSVGREDSFLAGELEHERLVHEALEGEEAGGGGSELAGDHGSDAGEGFHSLVVVGAGDAFSVDDDKEPFWRLGDGEEGDGGEGEEEGRTRFDHCAGVLTGGLWE